MGRTYTRAKRNGKGDIANRAALTAIDNGHKVGPSAFLRGNFDQNRHMDAVNIFPKYADGEDETMNYSIEKYRNLDNERKRELRGF